MRSLLLLLCILFCASSFAQKGNENFEDYKNTIYQPTEKRTYDITHTRLEIRPFFEKKSIYGKAFLNIQAYNHPIDNVLLDAQGMKIRQVFIIDDAGFIEVDWTYDDKKLNVQLHKTYPLEEQFTLFIEYTAHPYTLKEKGLDKAYGRGLYFIDPLDKNPLKPTQLWTLGETEANSIWFPTFDSPNEHFTQEIFITVDPKYTTLSNGIFKGTEINADGTKTDHWRQNKPHSPYLAMLAIGEFQVSLDDWGPIKVTYYTTPEYSKDVRKIFGKTPYMMSYFSNLLQVDFPWEKYAQVVVYDFTSGAMENTSASTFYQPYYADKYDALDRNYDDIIAHELMHQWFGDLVNCESWAHLTVNEAFATYGEFLWYDYKYGADEADKLQHDYLNIYLDEALYKVDPIVNHYYEDADEDLFDAHRYEKGSAVVHMLRDLMGDELFFKGLEHFLKSNRHQSTEISDLRKSLEQVSSEDYFWFFDQWFMKPGHPIVDINYDYDASNGSVKVQIDQVQKFKGSPVYRMPIAIDIYVDGKAERKEVWVNRRKETFEFKVSSQPDLVNVDAKKIMLWEKNDNKNLDEWAYQFEHAPLYVDRLEALQALGSEQNSSIAKGIFKKALEDKFWGIRQFAVKNIDLKKTPNEIALNKLKQLAVDDANSRVRAAALKTLYQYDLDLTAPIAEELLAKDSSRLVLGTALAIFNQQDATAAFEQAKKLEYIKNDDVAKVVAKIYSEQATSANKGFFKRCLWLTRASYANIYATSYADFLKRMDLDIVKDGAFMLADMVQYEEDESIQTACKNALYDLRSFFKNNSVVEDAEAKASALDLILGRFE